MDKKTWLIVGGLILAFVTLIGLTMTRKQPVDLELSQIIPASEESGGFEELVEGDRNAPVLIFEYGDYQCTACAPMNPHINELVKEYDGKVAVVFRTVIMSYHQNGTAAASAALAAEKQGYWEEYKDLLFTNQNDWYYSDTNERQKQFENYFVKVSDGKGDLKKFREDMNSAEVSKKISFDANLGKKADVEWTPYFMIDGEVVSQRNITTEEFLNKLRAKIDAKLKEESK